VRQYTASYAVPASSVTMCHSASTSLKPRTAPVDHIQTSKTVLLPGRARNTHFDMSTSYHFCMLTVRANQKICASSDNQMNQYQPDAAINYRFTACRLNTAEHVSGILMPIIRSLSTAAAAASGLP